MSRAQLTSTVEQSSGGAVAPFLAGKNKVINGDFYVNQRNFTTLTNPNTGYSIFDRWKLEQVPASGTVSSQQFTPGQTAVPGNPVNFIRLTNSTGSGQEYRIIQKIEAPQAFSGQTFTFSFWAKTPTTGNISNVYFSQDAFASGARTDSGVMGNTTLTTTWTKYTGTGTFSSVTGKTFNANTYASLEIYCGQTSGTTVDIAMIQLEAGPVATPFTTATGTVQGELAACQRYYWLTGKIGYMPLMLMTALNSSLLVGNIQFPVTMRTTPSFTAGGTATSYSLSLDVGSGNQAQMLASTSGLTTNYSYRNFNGGGDGTSYWAFSAEL